MTEEVIRLLDKWDQLRAGSTKREKKRFATHLGEDVAAIFIYLTVHYPYLSQQVWETMPALGIRWAKKIELYKRLKGQPVE